MKSPLLVAAMAALITAALPAQVLVNEFDSGTPDFVELINMGMSPADVSGWVASTWYATTSSGLTSETPFTIPASTVIAPGGFLVLQENGTAGAPGSLPSSVSVGFNYFWTSSYTVEVDLVDNTGAGVDYAIYDAAGVGSTGNNSSPWTGAMSGTGNVKYRNFDGDTDAAADWSIGGLETPGALNPGQFGAPQPEIVVVVSTNGLGSLQWDVTTANPAVPFAEIYNFVSLEDFQPDGAGPFFGVGFDALIQVAEPLSPTSLFHTNLDANGSWSLNIGGGVPSFHAEFVSIMIGIGFVERISAVDSVDF